MSIYQSNLVRLNKSFKVPTEPGFYQLNKNYILRYPDELIKTADKAKPLATIKGVTCLPDRKFELKFSGSRWLLQAPTEKIQMKWVVELAQLTALSPEDKRKTDLPPEPTARNTKSLYTKKQPCSVLIPSRPLTQRANANIGSKELTNRPLFSASPQRSISSLLSVCTETALPKSPASVPAPSKNPSAGREATETALGDAVSPTADSASNLEIGTNLMESIPPGPPPDDPACSVPLSDPCEENDYVMNEDDYLDMNTPLLASTAENVSVKQPTTEYILDKNDLYSFLANSRELSEILSAPYSAVDRSSKLFARVEDSQDPYSGLGEVVNPGVNVPAIKEEELKILELIGHGAFGEVSLGEWTPSHSEKLEVAVKNLKEGISEVQKKNFLKEILIMSRMSHMNVLGICGVVDRGQELNPWIVMPYCRHGSLKTYLRDMEQLPSLKKLIYFCSDIAYGMSYLASQNIIHRDLAARNVVVDGDEICKVTDFGFSRQLDEDIYVSSNTQEVPVRWTAPEALNEAKHSVSSDVWSFGVVMWEVFTKCERQPYDHLNTSNFMILHNLIKGERLQAPKECPNSIASIMRACWIFKPEFRPSFDLIFSLLFQIIRRLDRS